MFCKIITNKKFLAFVIILTIISILVYLLFLPKTKANAEYNSHSDTISLNKSSIPNYSDLEDFLHYLAWFYSGYGDNNSTILYDSNSPSISWNIPNRNILHLINDSLECINYEKYPIQPIEKGNTNDPAYDPLNKFTKNYNCTKVSEQSARWLLSNIFNCSESSIEELFYNYDNIQHVGSQSFGYYYYDGWFYNAQGGKGGPWSELCIDSIFAWNSYYYIKYNFKTNNGFKPNTREYQYLYSRPIYAKLSLNNIDGNNYWSLHYMSTEKIQEYIYPDWFSNNPNLYNNDMAKICAEASGKIEQSSESLETYLRQCGFYNYKYYSSLENFPIIGTNLSSVFSISHRKIIVDGKEQIILLLVCRGTQSIAEGIGDWAHGWWGSETENFVGEKVWHNVYEFEEQVYSGLVDYANTYNLNNIDGDKLKVIVTGHSLGGAVANAVTAKMNYEAGQDSWWLHRINKGDIYSYTFGAIKVLSNDYDNVNISTGYENIHNVYNQFDSFGPLGNKAWTNASMPKQKFGHTELFEIKKEETGEQLWDSNYCHNIETYIEALNKQNDTSGNFINLGCTSKEVNSSTDFIPWLLGLFGITIINE